MVSRKLETYKSQANTDLEKMDDIFAQWIRSSPEPEG